MKLTHRPEVVCVMFSPQKRLQVCDVSQRGAHPDDVSRFWNRTGVLVQSKGFKGSETDSSETRRPTAHVENFGQRHFNPSSSAAVAQHVKLCTHNKR